MKKTPRIQPLIALRAIRKLVKDPEDTSQVFEIIKALSGDSVLRGYRKFVTVGVDQKIFSQPRTLLETLSDREALRRLPMGSLGQAYLQFMETGGITAEGLEMASNDVLDGVIPDPQVDKYARRLRDQHDLWHVVTGYGRDLAGEACLLAFTYAQTQNRGLGFIAFVAGFKLKPHVGKEIFTWLREGYRAGKQASWLPAECWEERLAQPLTEVRQALGIRTPDHYKPLITNNLVYS